ncbi:MAG: HEAT repeat domain-containing protein, partial [Deltaproteobacteria bacterium]|nr:HEAT repeat domain-containing protein [Deltaproteobacteria bacterium]
MTNPVSAALDELIDQITSWPYGMPVRAMEQVLATGEAAIPAIAGALARWQDDEARNPLWLLVLLGELRSPLGIEPLIRQLSRTDLDLLAQAAGEALAKLGPPAVPALTELARSREPLQRLHAYGTLGWIGDEQAYALLADALPHDPELGHVLATALADQGRAEAIALLFREYQTCEPWQRVEFEEAIQDLHRGQRRPPLWSRDWRLRYRRLPTLEQAFEPDWVFIAAVVHGDRELTEKRSTVPLRSLEEITGAPPEPAEPPEACEDCGAMIEYPTGLPVFPETALSAVTYQLRFLAEAREDDLEDLFDLLDEIEYEEWEQRDRGEPVAPAARARWNDEVEELGVCRQTCQWLIEQGVEQVGPARALLLAEAARLADRYGDPEGLLRPVRPRGARGLKVGRNDPCPCGSGLKYKRC